MEIKRSLLTANSRKRGTGGTTFRVTIPTAWIREMGLGEEDRDLRLIFNGKDIRVINNIKEVEILKKLLSTAKNRIEDTKNQSGNSNEYLKELSQKLVEEEIEKHDDIEFYCGKEEYIKDLSEELLKQIVEVIKEIL